MEEKEKEFALNFDEDSFIDLDFGIEEEVVEDVVDVKTPAKPVVQEESKEEEEIEEGLDVELEEPLEIEEEETSLFQKVDAVRAVISNKIEKYGLSSEGIDIDNLSEEDLVDLDEQINETIIQQRVEESWNSLKSQDKSLSKMLQYIERNGDVKEIAKLFQEQKEVEQIDVETSTGQEAVIKEYYTKVLGWDEDKVSNKLERLKTTETLEEEAKDVKVEFDKYFDKVQDQKIKEQEFKQKKQEEILKQRFTDFTETLKTVPVDDKVKNILARVAFDEGVIKDTGEKVKVLDYKIDKLKSNPESFLKLVQFIADPESYDAFILQNKENKKTTEQLKKQFNFNVKSKSTDNVKIKDTTKKQTFKLKFE